MSPSTYLLIFAQAYEEFRLPELQSIDKLFNLRIDYLGLEIDIYRPYMKIGLEDDEKAKQLGSRAILIKHVLRLWADAPSYSELHQLNQQNRAIWVTLFVSITPTSTPPPIRSTSPSSLISSIPSKSNYAVDHTFKVSINSYKATISQDRKKQIIESLSYMDFQGPILLHNPQLEVMLSEEHESADEPHQESSPIGIERVRRMSNIRLRRLWLGEKVCDGQRSLVDKFDLKKRIYIGNTSMEAGLSLLMANQGLIKSASIVNDPFAGTGSMLYAAAWFGAYVFGSDIDGRPMRGKTHSIRDSAKQYGVSENLLDCAVFDMTQHPWRTGEFFDAIICDPPYGVRAGAKRLGRKDQSKLRSEPYKLPDGTWSHEKPDYLPPSKPWEMTEVLEGLLEFAARMLKPNGRLVYWLPTATQDYSPSDVPQREGLRLISNSCQDFGKWQRRLITMEKSERASKMDPADELSHRSGEDKLALGHSHFRQRYMAGFSEERDKL